MKLAQALILRSDTQKRIEQLKVRLLSNAKTQENESPSEDPKLLLKELDKLTSELFRLICSINLTNSSAKFDGMSLTEMIAKKDALVLKANVLREFATSASQKVDSLLKQRDKNFKHGRCERTSKASGCAFKRDQRA